MTAIAKKRQGLHELVATYDFAVHGGAVGTIPLGVTMQKGTVIWDGFVRVLTALGSAAAGTASLKVVNSEDLVADAAVSGAPWSSTGLKNVIPDGAAAQAIEVTTEGTDISLVITTGALNAGKMEIHLWISQLLNILS